MKIGKIHKTKIIKTTATVFCCILFGWFLKAKLTPQMSAMNAISGTPYVFVQKVEEQNIIKNRGEISIVEAINSAEIIPEVSGQIEEVLFSYGSFVNKGDILFKVDDDKYLATYNLRKAELASAQANLTKTERDYNRQKSLSRQNISSKATFDSAESAYLQAKANVQQAESNLELARIDLDKTQIKSPISGFIGKAFVSEGNYVVATANPIANVVQLDPIYISFSLTDKNFLNLKEKCDANASILRIVLPNGEIIEKPILNIFKNNQINPNTATIAVYAEIENKEGLLIPGNYVQTSLLSNTTKPEIIIPQEAILQDKQGNYVMVVTDEEIAEQRYVSLGDIIGSKQIVKEGLKKDEKIIVQGLQKVKNGIAVKSSMLYEAE